MVADRVRMDAYCEALKHTIASGDLVLDIGTGSGAMAVIAARLGARRVIAVEPDDVIEVAREVARANGVGELIEFIQGSSSEVELSPKANVIVSDLRGVLPLYSRHIEAIVDARTRLLAKDGAMIPVRDTIWAALVQAADEYARRIEPWSASGLDLELSAGRELVVNNWWRAEIDESQVLTEKLLVATLDYSVVRDGGTHASDSVAAHRTGTAHGVCLWFDAELTNKHGFSTAPGEPETIYGNALFPLSQPVRLERGDDVHLELRAIPGDDDYVWVWNTRVEHAGKVTADFRQSTALGIPLSVETLRRGSPEFVPGLSADGERAKLALELMDGGSSVREIANRLAELFPNEGESLSFVTRLARKYGR
jgi:protein arginine N-methyltransferase 1